jgi:hypothetical protein
MRADGVIALQPGSAAEFGQVYDKSGGGDLAAQAPILGLDG